MPQDSTVVVLGGSYGGGQKAISSALVSYLENREQTSIEVHAVDLFERFAPGLTVLARFGYERSADFFPSLVGTFQELARDPKHEAVVRELRASALPSLARFLEEIEPSAVISTFPLAGGLVAECKEHRRFVAATLVSDPAPQAVWVHPATDLYFVAVADARDDLVLRGVGWDRVIVAGIPVHAEGEELLSGVSRSGEAAKLTVAIAAGAGMTHVVELVVALATGGIRVRVNTGDDSRLFRRLRDAAVPPGLVEVFDSNEDTGTMVHGAAVVLARPGSQAAHVAMAAAIPIVLSQPIPGHEVRNADYLVNHGAALLARDDADALEKVRFLAGDRGRAEQMAGNMRALAGAGATQVICERMLAAIGQAHGMTEGQ
jgi:processive 1,2-diacylglycerol beta-glucosyltransferase